MDLGDIRYFPRITAYEQTELEPLIAAVRRPMVVTFGLHKSVQRTDVPEGSGIVADDRQATATLPVVHPAQNA